MSLEFLRDTPEVAFRRTISDLRDLNPKIDESVFEAMSIEDIDGLLDRLNERETNIIDQLPYGAWLENSQFMQIKMLQDGLINLREYREIIEESEFLVPGFTYYNGVKQFGKRVEGQICTYLGEGRPVNWINFIDSAPIMKALEVLKNGDTGDFRRLYIEIANGRPDGLENVRVEHITNSSDRALLEMENYCDARWEGPWPWEVSAPYRIGRIIEENKKMRQQTLVEMHEILNRMLREFDESGQEQFEIVSMAKGMSDNVQGIIEKLAKITGDAVINLKAMALTALGDEAAMKVEHGISQPLNQAADAMARLKANVDSLVMELQNHQPSDLDLSGGMGGDMGGMDDGMGAGGDMGGDMGGGDMGADPSMDQGADMGAGGAPGAPGAMPAAPGGMGAEQLEPERPQKKS